MPILSSPFATLVQAFCLASLVAAAQASAAIPQNDYDAVIVAARNGQAAAAINKLRAWQAIYPQDRRIIYDLATILNADGQHDAALAYRHQVLHTAAPAYAIKAMAHAARAAGQSELAETAYRLLLSKSPDDAQAHAGLVYALIGQGRVDAAFVYTMAWLPKSATLYQRSHVPMAIALAEIHELRQDWLLAADTFQYVLQFEPGLRFAIRGRVFALERVGMPFLARQLAQQQADHFSDDEKARLAHAAVAHLIRYGQAQTFVEDGSGRYDGTDAALKEQAALARNHGERPYALFDRLAALRNRSRMEEVVQLYQSLRASQLRLPAYAKFAAADAYLYLRNPAAARDLYLDGLQEAQSTAWAEQLDAQISLMYAYSEAEEHGAAAALADKLVDSTPKFMHKHLRGLEAANPEYTRVTVQRALLDLYSDRLEQAERQLAQLRMHAPFNSEIRAGWASLRAAREHPRAALDEYALLLVDQPRSVNAAVGHSETLLSLHELAGSKAALPRLIENYPENRAVQALSKKIRDYESPYFRAEATIGRGAEGFGAESIYEAALYSGPLIDSLGERFRLFSNAAHANGSDSVSSEKRSRIGLGADYRSRDVTAAAAVTQTVDGQSRSGLALRLSWQLSDRWAIGTQTDTNIVDLPAAALRNDVRARSMKLDATWRHNESRHVGSELQQLDFSDGNVRNLIHAWWRERWISAPRFRLESTLSVSSSNSDGAQRVYFNPRRDTESALTINGESIGWRHYQRSFKQKFVLRAGQYWQSGFGSGMTADLRYEHEWNHDDSFGFQYGIGRGFHPYDGEREYRSYLYLNFFGRLK